MKTGWDPPQASEQIGETGEESLQRHLESIADFTASEVDVSGFGLVVLVMVWLSPPDWPESETVFYV